MSSHYPSGEPSNHLHQTHHRPLPLGDDPRTTFVPVGLDEDATNGLPRGNPMMSSYSPYSPNSYDQSAEQLGLSGAGPGMEMNSIQTANKLVAKVVPTQHNHPIPHTATAFNPNASNGQHSHPIASAGAQAQSVPPGAVIHHNHPLHSANSPLASTMPNTFPSTAVSNSHPFPPTVPENLRKVRRWKVFPGRNRFFCNGRIIMAKQISVFYFTITLLTCTCILFFIFDCPFLATNVSFAIPAVAGVLFVFVLCTLLRTSFSDPGIIPRATPEEAADVERQIIPNRSSSPTYRPPPRTKEVIINNQPIKLKYCFTCKIFRPPRASHCSLCDNCVERFDHHCPWVGNCVGKRNYRFFYMFIVSLAFLCIYVFACIITHLILLSKDSSMTEAIKKSPVSMVEAIICFFSVWSILGLAGFHTYLIFSNLTTNEDIKGSFSTKRSNSVSNPYSAGSAFSNCFTILCTPVSPSLIHPRTYVYCDEQVLAQARHSNSDSSGISGPPRLMPRPSLNPAGYPTQPQYPNITPNSGLGGSVGQYNHNSVDTSTMHQNSSEQYHASNVPKNQYNAYGQYQLPQSEADAQQPRPTVKAAKHGHPHQHMHGGHTHAHHHPSHCGDQMPSECDSYISGGTGSCRSQPTFRKADHTRSELYYPYDQQSAIQPGPGPVIYTGSGKKLLPSTQNPYEHNLRSHELPSSTSYSSSMGPSSFKPPSGSRLQQQRASTPAAMQFGSAPAETSRPVLGARSSQAAVPGSMSRPKDFVYKN